MLFCCAPDFLDPGVHPKLTPGGDLMNNYSWSTEQDVMRDSAAPAKPPRSRGWETLCECRRIREVRDPESAALKGLLVIFTWAVLVLCFGAEAS